MWHSVPEVASGVGLYDRGVETPNVTPDAVPGLRERARRAVNREIADAAMALFATQGFDATTVDQIAEAAGISRRSFFRYFATKEDVVLGDLVERGRRIQAALAARPAGEAPWDAIRAALLVVREADGDDDAALLATARMLHDTPSLRARHLEKQIAWQELLVPELARRLRASDPLDAASADHRAAAVIASALACLDIATATWVRHDGNADLERLWDEAVAAVRA